MAQYRKLGKKADQRKALLRSQVTQLIYHGKIKTTEARAKEVRKIARVTRCSAIFLTSLALASVVLILP